MNTSNTMTISSVRPWAPDSTICDWLKLEEHLISRATNLISTAELCELWHCSQPTVSRRLARIKRAGLARITRPPGFWLWNVLRVEAQP